MADTFLAQPQKLTVIARMDNTLGGGFGVSMFLQTLFEDLWVDIANFTLELTSIQIMNLSVATFRS